MQSYNESQNQQILCGANNLWILPDLRLMDLLPFCHHKPINICVKSCSEDYLRMLVPASFLLHSLHVTVCIPFIAIVVEMRTLEQHQNHKIAKES